MPASVAPDLADRLRRALFSREARRRWAIALALLAVGVLVLALLPKDQPKPGLGWDKLDHLAAFATLAMCGHFAFRARPWANTKVAAALLAFGTLIELLQLTAPGRRASVADLVADIVGIAIGLALAGRVARTLDRRVRPRPSDR
jgi:VanZ family protein